jgi:hypothetical protein
MELVLNNPFRVLGLPATASARDFAKRISDLETFAELGKVKTYPHDLPEIGVLDRSPEAIKDAARKIEQAEERLFHSFFWFRSSGSVDDLALDSLAIGNVNEAEEIWNKQLRKKGAKKYTWRLNRAVLHLAKGNDVTPDKEAIDRALEDLGFVIDDDLEDSIQDVLAGIESGLDRERLWRRVVDEMIAVAQSSSGDPYGKNALRFVESLWTFPSEARDYATSKVVNPRIEEVQDAIKASEELRESEDLEALKAKNKLDKVEAIITDLKEILGEKDVRFQAIANAYANEICNCAAQAINKFKNPKLSMSLIQWAVSLPSFSRIKSRIGENLDIIKGWVKTEENDAIYEVITQKIKTGIGTLSQASNMLESMMSELVQIKKKTGVTDTRYLQVSSTCANRILDFLVDRVNSAQNTLSSASELGILYSTIDQATELTNKLLLLDLDGFTRVRINKNLVALKGLSAKLAGLKNTSVVRLPSSNGILGQIPAWVWIVGIVFLLSMCTGK